MTDIYEKHYKPMRNRLAKINLESALMAIWYYSAHRTNGSILPIELRPPSPGKLSYFQLSHLVALGREVVMHCARVGGQAFTYNTFSSVMNSMNDISDSLSAITSESDEESVFRSLDAILHQQLPLQQPMTIQKILRYARIFGDKEINPMVIAKVGFDYGKCYFFLFALMGSLLRKPQVLGTQDYAEFNIPPEACISLFHWVSKPVNDLALEMKEQSVLDVNWGSRWNLLSSKPLVQYDSRHPDRMYCPVPELLWQLIGQGMYYSVCRCRGFDHAFGDAFEAHVVEFAEFHLPTPTFTIEREQPFSLGKLLLDGADGMVSDDTGTLIIECKTKRLNIRSKQFDPGSALQEDLKVLSEAIVQLYKNIAHIQVPGRTHWTLRNDILYPILVTLEDWLLFSPVIHNSLELLVKDQLTESKLSHGLLESMPYSVVSCDEYEHLLLAISQRSVDAVMADKIKPERRNLMMKAYLVEYHSDALAEMTGAYDEKFERFHQQMAASWSPEILDDVAYTSRPTL